MSEKSYSLNPLQTCEQLQKLEVKTIDGKGRALYSKVNIKEGENIFEEEPLVCCQHSWNARYNYKACEWCMRPLESITENLHRLTQDPNYEIHFEEWCPTNKSLHTKCPNCQVFYCSENCREQAWRAYHQNMCHMEEQGEPLDYLNKFWMTLHYPPETSTIMLLVRMVCMVELAENPEAMYNAFMQFCHDASCDDSMVAKFLLGNRADQLDKLYAEFSNAMKSRKQYQEMNIYARKLIERDGFITLLKIVGQNGQGVGSSVLTQWVDRVKDVLSHSEHAFLFFEATMNTLYNKLEEVVGLSFLNNEATALYSLQSCINHSCIPNAVVTFPHGNNKLLLKALTSIEAGEEITISYIDDCALERCRYSRNKILKRSYFFTCSCYKCEQQVDQPNATSSEEEDEADVYYDSDEMVEDILD